MNSDAIKSERIKHRKQCLITFSNNSIQNSKFSNKKIEPSKQNLNKQIKISKEKKIKNYLTIKIQKNSDNPNLRKKRKRMKIRIKSSIKNNKNKIIFQEKKSEQKQKLKYKASNKINKIDSVNLRFNNTLDFDLLLKRLFPKRLKVILEEDKEYKKDLRLEKSQLTKLNKKKTNSAISKTLINKDSIQLTTKLGVKTSKFTKKITSSKTKLKSKLKNGTKTINAKNSKGILFNKVSFIDFKLNKHVKALKIKKTLTNKKCLKPKISKTLLVKPKRFQAEKLSISQNCNTPPIKKGFNKLYEENFNKKSFLNKKRKRSQSLSETGSLKNNDYNNNNDNLTIFEMKNISDNNNNNGFITEKKNSKFCKSPRKDPNIYDINNFVVQNFSSKIIPKKEIFKIPTPIFNELPTNFYAKNQKNKIMKKVDKDLIAQQNKENHDEDYILNDKKIFDLIEFNSKQIKTNGENLWSQIVCFLN